jgi:hypothetical protein
MVSPSIMPPALDPEAHVRMTAIRRHRRAGDRIDRPPCMVNETA